uniref:Uncharacterized protein n=1 Tax=Phytophthora fragariae TaxID=53985 RepID=A0A6A3DP57_9STRA|nr:hypothetical protein PF009_g27004 [Phytophthora fragariae]
MTLDWATRWLPSTVFIVASSPSHAATWPCMKWSSHSITTGARMSGDEFVSASSSETAHSRACSMVIFHLRSRSLPMPHRATPDRIRRVTLAYSGSSMACSMSSGRSNTNLTA